jgi:hypothetical protein
MFLADIYKSSQRLWSGTENAELLGFRNKPIPAGDMKANHPV